MASEPKIIPPTLTDDLASVPLAPDVVTLTDLIISHFDFLNPISPRGFES